MDETTLFEHGEPGDSLSVETWENSKMFKSDWSDKLMFPFTRWDHGGGVVEMDKDKVTELRDVLNAWLETQEGKPDG